MSHWHNSVVEQSDPGDIYLLVSLDEMAYTFEFTYMNSYIGGQHDDSGSYKGMTETILFSSIHLGLPDGHEWNAVAAGCICPLGGCLSILLLICALVCYAWVSSYSFDGTN
jgi:hypothetical protein